MCHIEKRKNNHVWGARRGTLGSDCRAKRETNAVNGGLPTTVVVFLGRFEGLSYNPTVSGGHSEAERTGPS